MRIRAIVAGLVVAAAAVGCGGSADTFTTTGPQCTNDAIITKFAPGDTTVSVGATFTARVTLTTCDGTRSIVDSYTWSSSDPSKVTIDGQTGAVKAIAVGSAQLTAVGAFYGSFVGGFVTVK